MSDSSPPPAKVSPAIALALLESLRALDTPADTGEEDDDLPAHPRRLGLSPAVEEQIQRYARLKGRKATLPATDIARLFGLIGRRPDARDVFAEAGRRLAVSQLREARGPVLRWLSFSRSARTRMALRGIRRIARSVSPGAEVRVEHRPPTLIIHHCLPARAAARGAGCALLESAIRTLLEAHGAGVAEVRHPLCEGEAAESCVWRVEPPTD